MTEEMEIQEWSERKLGIGKNGEMICEKLIGKGETEKNEQTSAARVQKGLLKMSEECDYWV